MTHQSGGLGLRAVSRRFGTVQALDAVDLDVVPGQVRALLGENGAGKSTVAKILTGLEQPDSGAVLLGGGPVDFGDRATALRHGVGLVPQQLSLVPGSLVDNLLLTDPRLLTRRAEARGRLRAAAMDAGADLDPDTPTQAWSRAERQLGELVLMLAQHARVLVLDEPTSALGPHDADMLLGRIRILTDTMGLAVVMISHKIAEVRAIADTTTVLRQGRVQLDSELTRVDDEELVRAMVGTMAHPPPRAPRTLGPVVLELDWVSSGQSHHKPVRDLSMSVRAGQIVAVLGAAGHGQRALADLAAGVVPPVTGTVTATPGEREGPARVRYVPEDRDEGLMPDRPAGLSAALNRIGDRSLTQRGRLRQGAITAWAQRLFIRHDVRPTRPELLMSLFSGGNAQKMLVGRELDTPDVAVLHDPTQGLDPLAAAAIRTQITTVAAAGTAVLLISTSLGEVAELADHVLVLTGGTVFDEFPIAEFDLDRIGRAMAGLPAAGTEPTS